VFGASTQQVLSAFQQQRGLHASGACDEPTWLALVEAGWSLGDRLLLLGAPQLRGDDVAQLQAALNHLGFDCGRPDGIMGPATARALEDFQRNSGLTADGVCGVHTVRMLELVSRQSGSGPGVAVVRDDPELAERVWYLLNSAGAIQPAPNVTAAAVCRRKSDGLHVIQVHKTPKLY